jgi:hypothetical protein
MEHEKEVRFSSIGQFRTFENTLNIAHLAKTIIDEVRMSGIDLKSFLTRTALCNHGDISVSEIRDLALQLFAGEKSGEILGLLERDKCLGYSQEEIINILLTLQSPEAGNYRSTVIQEALGCKIIKNLFHR